MDEFASTRHDGQYAGSVHLLEHVADSPVLAFIDRVKVLVLLCIVIKTFG